MKLIIGAGLTGLIAAHAWPQAQLIEAAPGPSEAHKALLRFRTDEVSKLTGIEFRRVQVRKGIWVGREFMEPNIALANLYSQKVLNGSLRGDRSIWNMDPATRFIAPEDFYEQMVHSVGNRIDWGRPVETFAGWAEPTINTVPLPFVLDSLARTTETPVAKCRRAPVSVKRGRIPGADLYQTIYYPALDTPVYRASITKDLLIIESADKYHYGPVRREDIAMVLESFGITEMGKDIEWMEDVDQKFGKIEPLADAERKRILFWLTQNHNIYSLGRFATWRNVLLDDVVDDIAVIKRISRAANGYDLRRHCGV